jgi:hypothetical protein
MGVMLALNRPRPPRSGRHGQHARNPDDQARADGLAAFLRNDLPGADRSLGGLARTALARTALSRTALSRTALSRTALSRTALSRRLLPAAAALAEAVGAVLAEDSRSGGRVAIDVTASPARVAAERVGRADLRSCQFCAGEHGGRGDLGEPGRGGMPAA